MVEREKKEKENYASIKKLLTPIMEKGLLLVKDQPDCPKSVWTAEPNPDSK